MLFRSNDTATTEIYTVPYTLSLHDALPISIPSILAMVQSTTAILNGEGARFWMVLLVSYDLVFTMVCLLLFEAVLNAE